MEHFAAIALSLLALNRILVIGFAVAHLSSVFHVVVVVDVVVVVVVVVTEDIKLEI